MSVRFITGDRSSAVLPLIAVELLSAVKAGDDIVTGDNSGTEQVVRELAQLAGLELTVVKTPFDDNGFLDWDKRHQYVSAFTDTVSLVHPDAHSSRIGRSVFETFADDAITLVTPESLVL